MLLIKFPPGLVLITVVQKLATGGIKIEPLLHLVGIDPGVVVKPHPVFGVYFGIVVFLCRGPGGEEKISRLARGIRYGQDNRFHLLHILEWQ